MRQKITPNLWFDTQAEEAAEDEVDFFFDIAALRRAADGAPVG